MNNNKLLAALQTAATDTSITVTRLQRLGVQDHQNYKALINNLEDFLAAAAALEHTSYFDLQDSQQTILKKMQELIS